MSRSNALERIAAPCAGAVLMAVSLLCAQEPARPPRAATLPGATKPPSATTPPRAATSPRAATPPSATKPASAAPQDPGGVAEIRATARAYMKAVREGDYRAAATYWNPAGDYIDSSGRKNNAQELFARQASKTAPSPAPGDESKTPEKSAGSAAPPASADAHAAGGAGASDSAGEPAPAIGAIRLVTPDVAIEDGAWSMPGAGGEHSRFTAVWTRSQGKWRLDSLREALLNDETPAERLAPLAWMVGQWEATHGSLILRMNCEWSPDKNFLVRELKAGPAADQLSILGTQRIGWDPISGRIKSWMFESDGGWGDGFWTRAGEGWSVRASVVHPDGSHATANTLYAPLDHDRVRVESTDVIVRGQSRPDIKLDFYRVQP